MSSISYNDEIKSLLKSFSALQALYNEIVNSKKINLIFQRFQIKQSDNVNAILEFHKGFNIIEGINGSGKTIIFELLRWILVNKKTSFIRHLLTHQIKELNLEVQIGNATYEIGWDLSISTDERIFGEKEALSLKNKVSFEQFKILFNKILGWNLKTVNRIKSKIFLYSEVQESFFISEETNFNRSFLTLMKNCVNFLNFNPIIWLSNHIKLEILNEIQLKSLKRTVSDKNSFNKLQTRNNNLKNLNNNLLKIGESFELEMTHKLDRNVFSKIDKFLGEDDFRIIKMLFGRKYEGDVNSPLQSNTILSRGQKQFLSYIYYITLK